MTTLDEQALERVSGGSRPDGGDPIKRADQETDRRNRRLEEEERERRRRGPYPYPGDGIEPAKPKPRP
jgi:hypothetical protein